MVASMAGVRKITVHIPEDLLKRAQRETGEGVTETVRRGLSLIASSRVFDEVRRLRGKVKVSLDLKDLREDRR
jgi:hypothetical protein